MKPPYFVYRANVASFRARRLIDVALALALMLLASPIVALAIASIFMEDGTPVFYSQHRAGRFERLFRIYKLRTMRLSDCTDRHSPTSPDDERVTRVGRYLRKFSIDELPQLLNVLRGDMSIVGPRPEMPLVIERYENWQHLRHLVTPGLTCSWQVTLRSTVPLSRPEATMLDLDYIRTASPHGDALLLFKTVWALVRPKGAY